MTTHPTDVRGGNCSQCGSYLVAHPARNDLITRVVNLTEIKRREQLRRITDSTIPYLICIKCRREIRRG